jgi:hypothetical protein
MRDHSPSDDPIFSVLFAALIALAALATACGPLPDDHDAHDPGSIEHEEAHEHGLPEPGYTEPDAEVFEGDASFEEEPVDIQPQQPAEGEPLAEEEPAVEEGPPAEGETPEEESAPVEEGPAPAPDPVEDDVAEDLVEESPTWIHRDPPADCPYVKIVNTDGADLNVRDAPTLSGDVVGIVGAGKKFRVRKIVPNSEPVDGRSRWFKIKKKSGLVGYIAGRYARCVDPTPSYGPKKFLLPFKCGTKHTVTQGNNGLFSHNGRSQYAFDFAMPRGTPIKASRKGRVIYRRNSTRPGDPCWNNGGSSCITKANYVVLRHPDGTRTMYAHLNKVTVKLGERVKRGQTIGKSGNTGWSSGPHLHFAREVNCGSSHCKTRKMRFADVEIHDGKPRTGDRVKSGNCPG